VRTRVGVRIEWRARELDACPGVSGAVVLPHVCLGWPVVWVAVVAFWLVGAVFWVGAIIRAGIELCTMRGPASTANESPSDTAPAAATAIKG
jgi:hypothetical protein